MKPKTILARIAAQEDLNFLLTNRIPRQALTRFIGWFSKIEQPLIRDLSIWVWKLFADLDLSEARETRFRSMHACFVRELRPGARPIDPRPGVIASPCDAIVGACGALSGLKVLQAKGFPYKLTDLLGDAAEVERYLDGCYATLRLTASMYHRFHAPYDCRVEQVTYISGDTWNVNPIALKRVERLFCKNERVIVRTALKGSGQPITLVAVAAVLVASVRLHFVDVLLHLKYRGPDVISCDARRAKGDEMGWFQHGSTIILFAPAGFELWEGVAEGQRIHMGEPLMRLPATETGCPPLHR
jgi:phosphatidylserine decarboxylase